MARVVREALAVMQRKRHFGVSRRRLTGNETRFLAELYRRWAIERSKRRSGVFVRFNADELPILRKDTRLFLGKDALNTVSHARACLAEHPAIASSRFLVRFAVGAPDGFEDRGQYLFSIRTIETLGARGVRLIDDDIDDWTQVDLVDLASPTASLRRFAGRFLSRDAWLKAARDAWDAAHRGTKVLIVTLLSFVAATELGHAFVSKDIVSISSLVRSTVQRLREKPSPSPPQQGASSSTSIDVFPPADGQRIIELTHKDIAEVALLPGFIQASPNPEHLRIHVYSEKKASNVIFTVTPRTQSPGTVVRMEFGDTASPSNTAAEELRDEPTLRFTHDYSSYGAKHATAAVYRRDEDGELELVEFIRKPVCVVPGESALEQAERGAGRYCGWSPMPTNRNPLSPFQ